MGQLIQVRRGREETMPRLASGELGFTTDTEKVFVGGLEKNIVIGGNGTVMELSDMEVTPTSPLTPPTSWVKGHYFFYMSPNSDSEVFNAFMTSIGITADLYGVNLTDLRAIVETRISKVNTGTQTITFFDSGALGEYQMYAKFTRASNWKETWGKWQEEVFIVEKGENVNGKYIRYSDGTQKCWCKQFKATTTLPSGNIYKSGELVVNFPASFTSDVVCIVNVVGTGRWGDIVYIPNFHNVTVQQFSTVNSSVENEMRVLAEGRWR